MAVYPRKQTVFIFIVSILAVGGVFFYVNGGFSMAKKQSAANQPVNLQTSQSADDLSLSGTDWQKQFIESKDSSSAFKAGGGVANTVPNKKLTLTDKLGREFLEKYSELRKTGLNEDAQTVLAVMGQVVSNNISDLPGPKTFSAQSVRTTGSSKAELKNYGNAVLAAFRNYLPAEKEGEIVNQALTEEDLTQLKRLDPVIVNYKNLLAALSALPAPSSLRDEHVSMLNGVSISLYNAESFRNLETDPIKGLAAVSLEMVGFQKIASAVASMQKFFVSAGVHIGS